MAQASEFAPMHWPAPLKLRPEPV